MKINNELSNIVLENILNYEEISDYKEIYIFFDKYDYDINESNQEKFNEMLIELLNQNFNIERIIIPRINKLIEYIDPLIEQIIKSYFSSDEHNSFISNYVNYFTDSQINFLVNECIMHTNNEENYVLNKIFPVLKNIKNKYMTKVIEVFFNIIHNNLIKNPNINEETFKIFAIIKDELSQEQKDEYVKNIINNAECCIDSLKKIKEISVKIPVECLNSIVNSYGDKVDNNEIFDIIKELLELNANELKCEEQLYLYQDFFISNINFSTNIQKDIKVLECYCDIDLTKLIEKYISSEFNKTNEKYLIKFIINKISDLDDINNIDFNYIFNIELSKNQINKLKLIINEDNLKSIVHNIDYDKTSKTFYNNLLNLILEIDCKLFSLIYILTMEKENSKDLKKYIVEWLIKQPKINFNRKEKEIIKKTITKEINESNDSDYIESIEMFQSVKKIPIEEETVI